MSRTPLFRLVRSILAQARQAHLTGAAAPEIVEGEISCPPLSRRRFVATTAAAGAGLALGGCASGARRPPGSDGPVIVVGAGIAGLTAAHRLRGAGEPVRVFEAQNRTGGRMLSLRGFFPHDQVCELGGELIDTGHEAIRALCAELGLELDDLTLEAPDIASETWWFGGARRSPEELVEAFVPVAARMQADLAGLRGPLTYRDPAGGAALDALSIADWLERSGVTGWARDLLAVAYTAEYGLEVDEQSALNLLTLLETDPPSLLGEGDERFHVRGGNDLITRGLAAGLEDVIETGTVLEALGTRSDGRFVCTFHRGDDSLEVVAADVVLALPFTLLRQVRLDVELPPAKRRAIEELGYGTNAKLMVGFSGRAWRTEHRSNGSVLTDLPFQVAWETSRAQEGASGILTNFTGGRQGMEMGAGPTRERAAAFVSDLERIFPGVAAQREGMREVRMHWPTHRWARGSYSCYRPGQWSAFRGAEGEAVGRLSFAGEHTSLDAQGFMEGGCESGERAAREVLRSRGVRTSAGVSRRALLAGLSRGAAAPAA